MSPQIKPIIFLSLFFLSSCVFLTENTLEQTISENSFLNRFPQNQKAIIIFKLSGKKNDKIYLCAQENIRANNINDCQLIYITNQYHILMLKPDLYYFVPTPPNHPIFSQNQIKNQEKYLTILEVKAGEIIYAGDIIYKQLITKHKDYENDEEVSILNSQFTILDNFELVQNLLAGNNSKQTQKLFANQTWEINYLIKEYSAFKSIFKKKLLTNFELKPPK
jgi:hypothetical protein